MYCPFVYCVAGSKVSAFGTQPDRHGMKNEEVGADSAHPLSFSLQPCPSLVVTELKKPGVPGLASAFIQRQRDESALLSSRRDKRGNCDTL